MYYQHTLRIQPRQQCSGDIEGSTKAENHNNGPVTEIQVAADHDADEVTASNQEDWFQRNDEENLLVCSEDDGDGITARPVSLSFHCNGEQSRCSFPETDTRSSPALEPPSVVILNSRSQGRKLGTLI
ncbi:hypothetical protein N7491_000765 [Penicillium cf. griseofulvum]|nr:hypothetical protein N7491_000765 [Penicillium cf. griseofulvum]